MPLRLGVAAARALSAYADAQDATPTASGPDIVVVADRRDPRPGPLRVPASGAAEPAVEPGLEVGRPLAVADGEGYVDLAIE